MHKTVEGILVGALAGFAVAVGGAIKDSPYEGFDLLKFIRSPAIAATEGGLINSVTPQAVNPLLLFLLLSAQKG